MGTARVYRCRSRRRATAAAPIAARPTTPLAPRRVRLARSKHRESRRALASCETRAPGAVQKDFQSERLLAPTTHGGQQAHPTHSKQDDGARLGNGDE